MQVTSIIDCNSVVLQDSRYFRLSTDSANCRHHVFSFSLVWLKQRGADKTAGLSFWVILLLSFFQCRWLVAMTCCLRRVSYASICLLMVPSLCPGCFLLHSSGPWLIVGFIFLFLVIADDCLYLSLNSKYCSIFVVSNCCLVSTICFLCYVCSSLFSSFVVTFSNISVGECGESLCIDRLQNYVQVVFYECFMDRYF